MVFFKLGVFKAESRKQEKIVDLTRSGQIGPMCKTDMKFLKLYTDIILGNECKTISVSFFVTYEENALHLKVFLNI